VFAKRLDLGPGERPRHLARVVELVARPRDDEQPPAGRNQLTGPREGRAPRRAGEHLQGEHLDHKIERAGPGMRRRQQVGGDVLHCGARKAPPGGIDSRRRHVEGHRGEAQRRDVLGIVAQPAADHDGAPAAADTGQRRDQVLIGRQVRPRHGRRALPGRRVQRLEPARVVTAGDGVRGEPPRERAARVKAPAT